jgi:hypothetical protein
MRMGTPIFVEFARPTTQSLEHAEWHRAVMVSGIFLLLGGFSWLLRLFLTRC